MMMKIDRCSKCVTDKSRCDECMENIKYRDVPRISLYAEYKAVCPFGMTDCVCDPGYIKYHYPEWYKDMYGNKTPEETVKSNHCSKSSNFYECYDDEDK